MTNNIPPKPPEAQWTEAQWRAIHTTGQSTLVAAAAGSGKTAVLVNRVIERVKHPTTPIDIDEMLIVTFTEAAAAEMKQRIGAALEEEIEASPERKDLKRQIKLLQHASISTMHSFCSRLIRDYYYLLDLDPTFRLLDEIEGALLKEEIIEQLLEEEYAREENAAFYQLIDSYTSDRSDTKLYHLILKLSNIALAQPEPQRWLNQLTDTYNAERYPTIDSLPYYNYIKRDIITSLEAARAYLQQALTIAAAHVVGEKWYAFLETEQLVLNSLIEHVQTKNFSELQTLLSDVKFGRAPATKKTDEVDHDAIKKIISLRDATKKQHKGLLEKWCQRSAASFIADFEILHPQVEKLAEVVQTFMSAYQTEKKARSVLDFSDLEHYALELLGSVNDQGEFEPTEIAENYRQKYAEIYTDEYQDTNKVQETLLYLVAKPEGTSEGGNRFIVGDVKQSIYRFRLAEPELFIEKYNRYPVEPDTSGYRIDLSQNFRSRENIIDSTNALFSQIMDETFGEIAYDEAAELKRGANYKPRADDDIATEIVLIEGDYEATELEESMYLGTNHEKEADIVAQRIKEMIANEHEIFDLKKQTYRSIRYDDIVILARSMTQADIYERTFQKYELPIYATTNSGYFESIEVMTMMAVLKVIDNPYQDIPLAAVLRSPIVGLTEEELAKIRLADTKGNYYDALLVDASEESVYQAKVKLFIERLENWRQQAHQITTADLIWQIYEESHYYDYVGGLIGGRQRQANLRALYDRAHQYEQTSFRGLFRFIRFIDRLQIKGKDLGTAKAVGEHDNVVRMMTIHKSKGLEFPIVFVVGLGKGFNRQDINSSELVDKEFGFASNLVRLDTRTKQPTIAQYAFRSKQMRALQAEEMRILYVALTRAKEKLILIGSAKKLAKTIEKWATARQYSEVVLPEFMRASATSYLDWIGFAFSRDTSFTEQFPDYSGGHQCSFEHAPTIKWTTYTTLMKEREIKESAGNEWLEATHSMSPLKDVTISPAVSELLTYQYEAQAATRIPSKTSVTEVKRLMAEREMAGITTYSEQIAPISLERPRFLQTKKMKANEIGTAMHSVMQQVPLTEKPTSLSVQALLTDLVLKKTMKQEEADVINVPRVVHFFETFLGELTLTNKTRREVPFMYLINAKEIYETETAEQTIVQGIVDCLVETEDGLIIIDYKTDRIIGEWEKVSESYRKKYEVQINLYAEAIEAASARPVVAKYLYFFDGGHIAEL